MTDLFNFRDLAGLPTTCERKIKPGKLFRTGNISHVSEPTVEKLTSSLDIKTYVDFRTEQEIKAFGRPDFLIKQGVQWVNLHIDTDDPMFKVSRKPSVAEWAKLYTRLFEENLKDWVQFLNLILESKNALLYGCVLGKDRTGIATSFLLTTLDVHDEHIESDYALTTESMEHRFIDRLNSFWDNSDLTKDEHFQHYLSAHPETIRNFVDTIRKRDDEIYRLLTSAGWTLEKREALKNKILE